MSNPASTDNALRTSQGMVTPTAINNEASHETPVTKEPILVTEQTSFNTTVTCSLADAVDEIEQIKQQEQKDHDLANVFLDPFADVKTLKKI